MRYKPFSFMGARQSGSFICAVGGTYETEINGYKYHIYSNIGSFNFSMSCNPSNDQLEVLVVGGGGNGGFDTDAGGGGGAGGVVFNQYVALPTGSYTMVVGGASSNSTFAASSAYSILAYGRASGNGGNADGGAGGIAPFPSQGNNGGDASGNNGGGGGGGVSEVGGTGLTRRGGDGGDGLYVPSFAILNTIDFGTYTKFGGFPDGWYGGGGSGIGQAEYGAGGAGGGGYTGVEVVGQFDVMDAIPNTGGGGAGGGAAPFFNRVGRGAKGMVIIRYRFSSI